MIKNTLSDIGGVGLYGIISVCLFFIVFTSAMIWASLYRKAFLRAMGSLPLEDGSEVKGGAANEKR
jgi:hypothetical protein